MSEEMSEEIREETAAEQFNVELPKDFLITLRTIGSILYELQSGWVEAHRSTLETFSDARLAAAAEAKFLVYVPERYVPKTVIGQKAPDAADTLRSVISYLLIPYLNQQINSSFDTFVRWSQWHTPNKSNAKFSLTITERPGVPESLQQFSVIRHYRATHASLDTFTKMFDFFSESDMPGLVKDTLEDFSPVAASFDTDNNLGRCARSLLSAGCLLVTNKRPSEAEHPNAFLTPFGFLIAPEDEEESLFWLLLIWCMAQVMNPQRAKQLVLQKGPRAWPRLGEALTAFVAAGLVPPAFVKCEDIYNTRAAEFDVLDAIRKEFVKRNDYGNTTAKWR